MVKRVLSCCMWCAYTLDRKCLTVNINLRLLVKIMRLENAVASEVLERILSAYGFTMQKELSDKLDIAKSNVASWLARGQVPGNVIVQCALDTGADVNWLVTGKLENANSATSIDNVVGKALYDEVMANGGKPVLRRILDAYGFTLQKQLCDLLDISSGTVSTWIRRNYFPGDVVVTCALDTGVSLKWLATGKGSERSITKSEPHANAITKKSLSAGLLDEAGDWVIDLSFLPKAPSSPVFVCSTKDSWLIDTAVTSISNGRWLLGIDGKYDVYDVALLPGKKINVKNKSSNFSCGVDEIEVAGKVVLTMDYNF